MKRILIASVPRDSHASAVAWGLRVLNHEAVVWDTGAFPLHQHQSIRIDGGFNWEMRGEKVIFSGDGFDTIWFRRPALPKVPDHIHARDKEFVGRELACYSAALWSAIERDAFWVNPLSGVRAGASKALQLRIAQACCLDVPPTLISNDPSTIRGFLRCHETQGTICKTFLPVSWKERAGRRKVATTSVVTQDCLPPDRMLEAVPGIFQARVPKDFEIRLTMFGDFPLAVRIDSQRCTNGTDDWRNIPPADMPLSRDELPSKILDRCRVLMRRLDIVFGCFDFIVRPDGAYIFLEVNEAGQFLWIEDRVPDIPMLDTFCRFLAHGARNFLPGKPAAPLRLADFDAATGGQGDSL